MLTRSFTIENGPMRGTYCLYCGEIMEMLVTDGPGEGNASFLFSCQASCEDSKNEAVLLHAVEKAEKDLDCFDARTAERVHLTRLTKEREAALAEVAAIDAELSAGSQGQ